MATSSPVLDRAEELIATGHHAEAVEYLARKSPGELAASPGLALLYGTAQARLGHHEEGARWLDLALAQARSRAEEAIARRALNARGALALVSGRMDEAADYFTQAMMAASRDADHSTTGRCSNNMGIISQLHGRHAEAIGSWEIAVASFAMAGLRQGVAECRHNLSISYREQGALDRALTEADCAVAEAEAVGDVTLLAMALRGRAEIWVRRDEVSLAQRELDRVATIRGEAPQPYDEAEDRRVAALVLAAQGRLPQAEQALRQLIAGATPHRQPQLLAEATRDLALLLARSGRHEEARATARAAKMVFAQLGAEGEIRSLARQGWDEDFAAELRRSLEPLHEAQALADAGRYAELVTYLSGRSRDDLEQSPLLALLCGIAHGRLGRLDLGEHWAKLALARAQVLGDRRLEVRALNVCGAVALEVGGIDQAAHFFTRAQEEAMQDKDMATVGRCANNLGIIANLQGDYGRAVGAYTRAIAAYQKAGFGRGIAESQHNLGITYRLQGQLGRALRTADVAVREAERIGDRWLKALAAAGRAEIQVLRGEPRLAVREAECALAVHRELKHVPRDTQRELPLYDAIVQRDLACQRARAGETAAARQAAERARATFDQLGVRLEIAKLSVLLGELQFREG